MALLRRNFQTPRMVGAALIASFVAAAGFYLFTFARNFPPEDKPTLPRSPEASPVLETPSITAPDSAKETIKSATPPDGLPSSQTRPSSTSQVDNSILAKPLTLYEKMLPREDQARLYELQPKRTNQRATLACDTKGKTHLFADYKGLNRGEIFGVTLSDGAFRQKYMVADDGRSVLRVDASYIDSNVRIITLSARTVTEVKTKSDPFVVDVAARQFLADCRPFNPELRAGAADPLSRLSPRERLLTDVRDQSQRLGYFRSAVTVPIYEERFFSLYFVCGGTEPLFLLQISQQEKSIPGNIQLIQTSYAGGSPFQIKMPIVISDRKAFWQIGRTGLSLDEVSSIDLSFVELTKDFKYNLARPPIYQTNVQFDAFAKSVFQACAYD